MINYFSGKSVEWLVARRDVLQDLLAGSGGSETRIALAPGMYDEFSGLTEAQLETRLTRILSALHELEPTTYTSPATKRSGVTLSNFR